MIKADKTFVRLEERVMIGWSFFFILCLHFLYYLLSSFSLYNSYAGVIGVIEVISQQVGLGVKANTIDIGKKHYRL